MLPLSVKLRALESAQDEEVLAEREASWLRRFAGVIGHGRDDVVSVPLHPRASRGRTNVPAVNTPAMGQPAGGAHKPME